MEQQILVYYFIREMTIHAISVLLKTTRYYVSTVVNEYLKPSIETKYLILESKMNAL